MVSRSSITRRFLKNVNVFFHFADTEFRLMPTDGSLDSHSTRVPSRTVYSPGIARHFSKYRPSHSRAPITRRSPPAGTVPARPCVIKTPAGPARIATRTYVHYRTIRRVRRRAGTMARFPFKRRSITATAGRWRF